MFGTFAARPPEEGYDLIVLGGHVIDGSGNPWFAADIGIRGDRITAIGMLDRSRAKRTIDASGMTVAPGFIDMLGQSEYAVLADGRALSKLSQGITSEITGEGESAAPQTPRTIEALRGELMRYGITIDWNDLDEYFHRVEKKGCAINLGTYVGATQVRQAVIGADDREPTNAEVQEMKRLVAEAMRDGAIGLSSALIYPPASYAKTEELIELAKIAGMYGGIYATHLRSEGQAEMEAISEAIRVGREAHVPVEIFHLKASGQPRWGAMPQIVGAIQTARSSGVDVAADMYPYLAGVTALASALPPWVANGGEQKMLERLHDPKMRRQIKNEMAVQSHEWENMYLNSGGAEGITISWVIQPALTFLEGKTLATVAKSEEKDPLDVLIDIVIADKARTGALYFLANESDLEVGLKQTWTSIGLDSNEMSLDGPLFKGHPHPRAFGSMPRFLGHYVRERRLVSLEDAIRKITSLPAQRVRLQDRGLLRNGFYADLTIFDPARIEDKATYDRPTQVSVGVEYVIVNGSVAFEHGHLTGILAGRPLRGPGWKQSPVDPLELRNH